MVKNFTRKSVVMVLTGLLMLLFVATTSAATQYNITINNITWVPQDDTFTFDGELFTPGPNEHASFELWLRNSGVWHQIDTNITTSWDSTVCLGNLCTTDFDSSTDTPAKGSIDPSVGQLLAIKAIHFDGSTEVHYYIMGPNPVPGDCTANCVNGG